MTTDTSRVELDAVVVGAGFAGMYMLHRLREVLGLSARVFEAGDNVGGTWYWNRYPGARCDSESYLYCFSFDKDLAQEWTWSGKYPEQPEILRYLNHVADRFDLRPDIQFETRVTAAHFREDLNRWEIETDQGDRVLARYFITGVGCISAGQMPDIQGLDSFEGDWYHTGSWPHEGVDFAGKRVGRHRHRFERGPVDPGDRRAGRPPDGLPAHTAVHDPGSPRHRHARVPRRGQRALRRDIREEPQFEGRHALRRVRSFGAGRRRRGAARTLYEAAWEQGGFRFVLTTFSDIAVDRRANDTAAEFIRSKIRETVDDPETAEKLVPRDHPFGSKRALIDTNYFETYNRDNVELVDIRHSPIEEITANGIRTQDSEYELDIIVFATGYDGMTGSFNRIDIRGRGGVALKEKWAEGPRAYLGLSPAAFPNMFMITGPGSPSVLSNMPPTIEQHVEWISDFLAYMAEHDVEIAEAEADAETEWVDHVNDVASKTLYMLADSWYLGANVPGKPRVFMPYAGGLDVYSEKCDEIAEAGYEGYVLQSREPVETMRAPR